MNIKLNIDVDKKTMILIAGVAAAGMIFLLLTGPLFGKVSKAAGEARVLDGELAAVRAALKNGNTIDRKGHLLKRVEVSKAIDEITKVGTALNINFLSTSLQQVRKPQGMKYPVLPIRMEVRSTYKNLGVFLGALEGLSESITTVKEFTIKRKRDILPEVYAQLVVEIYLKKDEGG